MIAPLSKYIVVQYWTDHYWDIYQTQYLDTIEDARACIISCQGFFDDDEKTSFKIFELKEVQ